MCDGVSQQRSPYLDFCQRILIFRLRQQVLRVGHFDDTREASFIAGPGLRLALLCGCQLDRRVRGHRAGSVDRCCRGLLLAGHGE